MSQEMRVGSRFVSPSPCLGVKPAWFVIIWGQPARVRERSALSPDHRGSDVLLGSNPLRFHFQVACGSETKGIKRVVSELMTKDITPFLLRFTRSILATTVIDDGKDLTTFNFTSRGNHRRPNTQLHRRAAGSDQGFERGS